MAGYHKYVFDEKNRRFVGKFEEMYRAESQEGFDSWRQEDLRSLKNQICLAMLNQYNFYSILDVGCGKGAFTHLLKKANNQVHGVDISETAINRARIKYPDIVFTAADLTHAGYQDLPVFQASYDVIIFMEILSYLPNWPEVLQLLQRRARFFLASLFIPENPVGFVKSREDLLATVEKYYKILEDVHLVTQSQTILLGKSLES
jgi:2-polyprenyl-3-methyl-5-hydroxy-6-metoxy-1,4-benzoquinol methylase